MSPMDPYTGKPVPTRRCTCGSCLAKKPLNYDAIYDEVPTSDLVRQLEARLEETAKNLAEAHRVIEELAKLVLDLTGERDG